MVDMIKGVKRADLLAALDGDSDAQERIFCQLRPLLVRVIKRFWRSWSTTEFGDFENAAFIGMMEGIQKFVVRERPIDKLFSFVKWEVFRQCKVVMLQERALSCPSGLHLGQLSKEGLEMWKRSSYAAASLETAYVPGGDLLVDTIADSSSERPTEDAALDRVWRKQADRVIRESAALIGLSYGEVQVKRCEASMKRRCNWRAFSPVDREALAGVLPTDLI